jgi:type IV conjugative transfer system protein TraL
MRMLFWEIDEICVMIAPFFLGICCGSFLLALMGFIVKPFYTKMKKKFPQGTLKPKLYWHFPTKVLKNAGMIKNLPESHVRNFFL